MMKTERYLRNWEIAGFFWIVIIGALLHFTYHWFSESIIIALFSPVNESVWEHLKLGYWSVVFFSLLEYSFIRGSVNNFIFAKAAGVIALEIFIVLVHYSIKFIFTSEILWIDIGSYIIAAFICQLLSWRILTNNLTKRTEVRGYILGLVILLISGLLLMIFTFNPPHMDIFKDRNTGQYGIKD